jgi:hypothetical protein
MNHPVDLPPRTDSPRDTDGSAGRLWPSPDYSHQVERLKAAVGETVYLAEIDATEVQLGVRITGKPYVLLGVVDFPRPDPVRGLAPHLILLDDGRGVNLGRILRLSVGRAFAPAPGEVLFQDHAASRTLLFGERRLTPALIAERSRALLGEVLGQPVPGTETRLEGPRQLLGQEDGDGVADPATRPGP